MFYCFILHFCFCGYHIPSQLNNKWQLIRKTDNNKSMITSSSTTSTKIFIFSHFQTSCFGLFYQGLKPFWPQIMLEILFLNCGFHYCTFHWKNSLQPSSYTTTQSVSHLEAAGRQIYIFTKSFVGIEEDFWAKNLFVPWNFSCRWEKRYR